MTKIRIGYRNQNIVYHLNKSKYDNCAVKKCFSLLSSNSKYTQVYHYIQH